jgi:hypothetical protein
MLFQMKVGTYCFVSLRTNMTSSVLPNVATRNINGLFHLKKGSFVIVRNVHRETSRTYIGKVLDLYKMASGNCYGSVKTANTVEELKYLSVKVYLPLMVACTSLAFH